MATYLVGDIQGCLPDLKKLLAQANFDPQNDHLWLAGDLVARGPESLETLRFVKALGDHATVILGNHDLHLLAVSHQLARAKKSDNIHQIFSAEDGPELLNWLRHQPLLAEHPHYPLVMVHAGITPQWTLEQARQHAQEVEQLLQSDDYVWLLKNMYGDGPDWWQEDLSRLERLRFTINSFTRMRFCDPLGRLDMHCKVQPNDPAAGNLIPWFDVPRAQPVGKTIIFGHWAALMGHQDEHCIGLDTGCVWGNSLTMLRWEDRQRFVTECPLYA
ncbi:symmetrical bis(5'-nucleosyl)-tetraphosphatase [Photobacterium iliopiscarium]|uniref:symmetrical bis(5'-nucleosyl)-tetraphosphatase n=1 Tax=Photobacterium iliopiscarium TaxID=56192 RepID=UPI0005D4608D|nr:symmetrical bis(5'-nucleosyl)-tetraphosphatase [Photobacterium iliopiscarium]KJG14216.1 bis(5'-nucleosyl)-tetraphosphatase [Photobacterium iliopiscarium]PST98848.1 symmetrical bis(5'-nucleosyl)-tetraphosphatase [Photobacterium iliopiscarium]PSV81398.1 symmetrical bis(5'-nucleosyl)-tetraphosphatase [Photobacterium iliopiscarium]